MKAMKHEVSSIQFRSKLEARWNYFLGDYDCNISKDGGRYGGPFEWPIEYEPYLHDVDGYIPDFIIFGDKKKILVEVKPISYIKDFYEDDTLRIHKNVNWVPTLTKTLQDIGITRRASIASMKPKAKIPLHRDGDPNPPDGIVLRGIIGLDVPVEEGKKCYIMVRDRPKKTWQTREIKNQSVCLFQPNAIHSVINQLNGWRYVVLFDTVVWFEDYPEVVKSCRTTGCWANLD